MRNRHLQEDRHLQPAVRKLTGVVDPYTFPRPINPDVTFGVCAFGLALAVNAWSSVVACVGLGVVVLALAVGFVGLLLEGDPS